jgi:hypothetical protein
VNAELWIGTPIDLGTLGGPNSNVSWPNHSVKGEIVGIAETAQLNPYGEKRTMSAAARRRISLVQKARWAKIRAAKKAA